jgi:hypothetical protein
MKVGDLVVRKDQSKEWIGLIIDIRHGIAQVQWNNPYLDPRVTITELRIISESR